MGEIIMVASGKGGSGTTTLTTNMGVVLANTGAKVLICDMNIGLRNDDIFLGMENRVLFDLGDVMCGTCSPEKAILNCELDMDLYLLPCPQCKQIPGLSVAAFVDFMGYLKEKFDFIILDCPVGMGRTFDCCSSAADRAVFVFAPDIASTRNTDAVARRVREFGVSQLSFVLNKVYQDDLEGELSPEQITQTMEMPLAGIIYYDDEIEFSNREGEPIVLSGDSSYLKNFIEIVSEIVA